MGANFRPETLLELVARGNVAAICWCGHRGAIDGRRLARYFMARRWDGRLAFVGERLRCSHCGRRRPRVGLTHDLPTFPSWGPQDEAAWERLVKRLRG